MSIFSPRTEARLAEARNRQTGREIKAGVLLAAGALAVFNPTIRNGIFDGIVATGESLGMAYDRASGDPNCTYSDGGQPYTVQVGDRLWDLATDGTSQHTGATIHSIRSQNGLTSGLLTPGATIQLPSSCGDVSFRLPN